MLIVGLKGSTWDEGCRNDYRKRQKKSNEMGFLGGPWENDIFVLVISGVSQLCPCLFYKTNPFCLILK